MPLTILNQSKMVEATEIENILKMDKRKYLIRIIVLIIINSFLYPFAIKGQGSITDKLMAILSANLIGFNIAGFLIGIFVALIPYKSLNYKNKYLRSSLLSIFVLQTIMAIGLILMTIKNIFL